jgi:hypothetical protein
MLTLFGLAGTAAGYFETDLPSLKVPTNLKPGVLAAGIEHRLLPGLTGADVVLGVRYCIWSHLEAGLAFSRNMDLPAIGFDLGAGYAYHLPGVLRVQADGSVFSYKRDDSTAGSLGYLGLLSLQSEPLGNFLTPVFNVGYDGERGRLGIGAGLNAGFKFELGPLQRLNLSAEYAPVIGGTGPRTGRVASFVAGLTLETYGHHFALTLGNGLEPGSRRFLAGAPNNDLKLGFNIHRFLDLKTL